MINKKVYVVDDDEIALYLTEMSLKQASNQLDISSFISSVELLNKFKGMTIEQPDILIVDINMPVVTGFELIRALVDLPNFNTSMKIYIQSSSIRQTDLDYVSQSKHINRHYEKFMTVDHIKNIL